MDALQSLEQEAAMVHEELAKCHAMLADITKRRDVLLLSPTPSPGTKGTTINVPAAKMAAPKGH